jgi:hypothetical protein
MEQAARIVRKEIMRPRFGTTEVVFLQRHL